MPSHVWHCTHPLALGARPAPSRAARRAPGCQVDGDLGCPALLDTSHAHARATRVHVQEECETAGWHSIMANNSHAIRGVTTCVVSERVLTCMAVVSDSISPDASRGERDVSVAWRRSGACAGPRGREC